MIRHAVASLAVGLAIAAAPPALAQELTREELKAELQQRDKTISDLEQRVSALEARLAAAPQAGAQAPAQAPKTLAQAQANAQAGATNSEKETAEETAELQALSRGLVERGLELLPRGAVEVSPGGAYTSIQKQGLILVTTPEGISSVSDQRLRDDFETAELDTRIGLPWHSQIEVRLPYQWRRETSALGDGSQVQHSDSHVGDVQAEFDHQFLFEKGARPDLIVGVIGSFPTGRDPFTATDAAVADGRGTYQIAGRLTLLKTVDPLVGFTTVAYEHNFSTQEPFGRVHPGDVIDWQLGALLAISPETSLSLAFDQQFQNHTSVDHAPIAGSNGVAALVQVGIDQVLSPKVLMELNLGIGLNHLAPDYQLMLTLPVRFK